MRPLRAPARTRRVVGAATVVVLASSLMTVGGLSTAAADRSDRAPDRTASGGLLERPGRGPEVLRRLADGDLAEAARRNGRSTQALRKILQDPTAGLGTSGRVFYAEPADDEHTAAARTETEGGSAASPSASSLEDPFTLHSRPGAARTLYIDVDGHQVSDTLWNRDGWPSAFYPGFVDSHADATEEQKQAVHEIWQRVAEDYAPFDVNVTTEDPGPGALGRSTLSDTVYGMRALVVDSRKSPVIERAVDSAPCHGCVGIAYMGTWGDPSGSHLQPVLAFADRVEGDPWQVAETISHEVGHSFDLEHHGKRWSDGWMDPYYTGHGAWSPIMGAGNRGLTQWSRGEYTGASRAQDDLRIIARGAPRVGDDYPDTPAAAHHLGPDARVTVEGMISSTEDHDVFAITRGCTGPLDIAVTPAAAGANLDVSLRVIGPDGAIVVPRTNPTTSGTAWSPTATNLGATASVPAPAPGTHYIEVTGGEQGDPTTGWTAYGSLGHYTLTVDSCDDAGAVVEPSEPPEVAHDQKMTFPPVAQPEPEPVASPPGRPAPLRVRRGPRGGPRTLVVRWGTAEERGTPVTGYVVRARKVADGRVVKTARRTFGPGKRRSVWRLKPGRYRFMVRATSAEGPGLRTKWSRAKRPR